MLLLKFIEKETTKSYHQIIVMATISGIANTLLLAIVNHAAYAVAHHEDLTRNFFLYMIVFALFLYAQWFAFEQAILAIGEAIYNTRIRLTGKVRLVELEFMERVGSNNLYARLTQNDTLISQSIPQFTAAAQIFILIICSFLYLGYISPISFIISIIAMLMGGFSFLTLSQSINKALLNVRQKEATYFRSISQLVNGFKEIKINTKKGSDLLENIAEISGEANRIKNTAGKQESRLWGFGRVFVYVLLPILVFIIPNFSEEHAVNMYKITATMLFITGPITIIMNMLPLLNRVNLAIGDLLGLEEEMDAAISKQSTIDNDFFKNFKTLTINNVEFSYSEGNNGFSVGPVATTINRGELLFIIGGNGSGKSTLLKLLTGLYYPVRGRLQVDSVSVSDFNYPAYRSLFSVIFTDFYLFDKFYGIKDVGFEDVHYWLEKMQMHHKVSFHEGGFTSVDLSTGQRKRLAFIAAILENKPILVLDEFAADQDPQFRRYFYETLLKELKERGITVIAVTHDDHYFHVADRIMKMEEGMLSDYSTPSLNQAGTN